MGWRPGGSLSGSESRGPRSVSGQHGAVTAEFAVALPAVVTLLATVLAGVSVGATQLRIEEAARAGAREIMRGEGQDSAARTVQQLAGTDAQLSIVGEGQWTRVQVSAPVRGPILGWADWHLDAEALARPESSTVTGPVGP